MTQNIYNISTIQYHKISTISITTNKKGHQIWTLLGNSKKTLTFSYFRPTLKQTFNLF